FVYLCCIFFFIFFFFSSRRRHTRLQGDWSSDVCSSDLISILKICLCAIWRLLRSIKRCSLWSQRLTSLCRVLILQYVMLTKRSRSEERRVGKECRSQGWKER